MKQILYKLVALSLFSPIFLPFCLSAQPSIDPELTVDQLLLKGYQYEDSGKYELSLHYFSDVLDQLPTIDSSFNQKKLALTLQLKIGQLYQKQGAYMEADSMLTRLFDALKVEQGMDTLNAEAIHTLGSLHYDQGEFAEARAYLDEALELKVELYTAIHPSVANTLNVLGNLVSDEGQFQEARGYYEEALQIRQQVLPEEHPHISDTYQNLGLLFYAEGDYAEAAQFLQKSFVIDQKNYPPEHPIIASSFNNLGVIYDVMGNAPRALSYYEQALEIRKNLLGDDHPSVAQSYNNMGVVYQEQGDYRRALDNYRQSLFIFQKVFDNDDKEEIASILENMGVVYSSLKNYEQAHLYLKRAFEIHRKLFGDRHLYVADNLDNLASLEMKKHNYEGALTLLQEAAQIYRLRSPDHPYLNRNLRKKAELYKLQGRYKEAIKIQDEAYLKLKQAFSLPHPQIAHTLNEKASIYAASGQLEEAVATYQQAIWANISQPLDRHRKEVPDNSATPSSLPYLLNALHQKALLHLQMEDSSLDTAVELWELAIFWVGKAQKEALYQRSKIDWRTQVRDICEGLLEAYVRLYKQSADIQYLERAFQIAEYSQSALLHEWIQEVEAQDQANIPTETLALESDLRANMSYYQKKLYDMRREEELDSSAVLGYQAQLFEIRRRHDSLVHTIEEQYPAYYEMKFQNNPLDIAHIQSKLKKGERIVRYFLTNDKLYTFCLSSQALTLHDQEIGPSFPPQLLELIEFVQTNPLEARQDPQRFLSLADTLYQQLIAPIWADDITQLMIIPDELLGYLPFEVLLTESLSTFLHYSDLPYLIKSVPISYAYSVQLFFHPWKNKQNDLFMGFAPQYQQNSSQIQVAERKNFSPLFYNVQEVQSLATLLDGKAYLGEAGPGTDL